jgi:hypothetical protein
MYLLPPHAVSDLSVPVKTVSIYLCDFDILLGDISKGKASEPDHTPALIEAVGTEPTFSIEAEPASHVLSFE